MRLLSTWRLGHLREETFSGLVISEQALNIDDDGDDVDELKRPCGWLFSGSV